MRFFREKTMPSEKNSMPQGGAEFAGSLYWFLSLLPAFIVLFFYLPVLRHELVLWDDPVYITDNPHIRSFQLSNLQWMWTTFYTGNWIPLTWMSLALDYKWAGLNPWVYHLHNVLLHCLNTILVFFLSLRLIQPVLTGGPAPSDAKGRFYESAGAVLASLLFGLHPIHVESVAWASERKDVLCAFFYLASLLVYLDYASRKESKPWKLRASFCLFLLALMSKPMAMSLPLVLLILDAWPLGRYRLGLARLLREKILFLAAGAALVALTILAQYQSSALINLQKFSPVDRIMNSFHSLSFYLVKMAVPWHLTPFYPISENQDPFSLANLLSALLILGISAVCFALRKEKPYLAAAWVYYILTEIPVLGLVQAGMQAAADRYTYLPSLGLFILVSGFLAYLFSKKPDQLMFLSLLLAGALGAGTLRQMGVWENSINLWRDVARVNPDVALVHADLARTYAKAGRVADALMEYDRALAIPPPDPLYHDEKGTILSNLHSHKEAVMEFQQAISLYNGNVPSDLYHRLWYSLEAQGKHQEALRALQVLLNTNPSYSKAYSDLGVTYWNLKRFKESEEALKTACSLDPFNPEYLDSLGSYYHKRKNIKEALVWYKKGLMISPNEAVFYLRLGNLYEEQGNFWDSLKMYQSADKIQPGNAGLQQKINEVLAKAGNKGEAK